MTTDASIGSDRNDLLSISPAVLGYHASRSIAELPHSSSQLSLQPERPGPGGVHRGRVLTLNHSAMWSSKGGELNQLRPGSFAQARTRLARFASSSPPPSQPQHPRSRRTTSAAGMAHLA